MPLKCECGNCSTCRSRKYARKRAAKLRVEQGKPAVRRRIVRAFRPDVDMELPIRGGRNCWTDSHSKQRLEAFFAQRRALWGKP